MADVIERATLAHRQSVNTGDYDPADFIIYNDANAVATIRAFVAVVPQNYRKLVGDVPTEMDQSEKDAVDAAAIIARDDAEMADLRSYVHAVRKVVRMRLNTIHDKVGLPTISPAAFTAQIRTQLETF